MKKIFIFLSAVLGASIIAGCGSGKSNNDATDEMQDSIGDAENLTKARRDSIAWANFTTPDLMVAGAHGHVQMIKELRGRFGVYVAYKFDKNGNLISYTSGDDEGGVENYDVTRDDQGRIATIKEIGMTDGSNLTTFSYDENGKPISIKTDYEVDNCSEITIISLDEQGRSSTYDSKYYRSGCAQTVKEYKYIQTDSLGNWSMCTVKNKFRRSLSGESGLSKAKFENDDPETYTRAYSYYPMSR